MSTPSEASGSTAPASRVALRLAVITLAYFLTGRLGLELASIGSSITLIWLSSGIAVAAMFRWGWRYWPAVWLGALATDLSIGSPILVALGISVGNTLAPLLSVALLRRWQFNPTITNWRDVPVFVGGGLLAMLVSATGGVATLAVSGILPWSGAGWAWLVWWLGDSIGVVVGGMPFISFDRNELKSLLRSNRRKEFIFSAWFVAILSLGWLIVTDQPVIQFGILALAAMTMVWVAQRLGPWPASAATLALSISAAWSLHMGQGPFIDADHQLAIIKLWIYITTLSILTMLESALTADRKQLEEAREEALNRLQKIASQVPGIVYQYRMRPDGSSSFPFASEAIREIFRISPEDVREDASSWFANFLHPDDYADTIASILKSAQDLTPWHHECRVKFEDGTIRWMLGNAVPQREADGSTLWHGFITDVTERKLLEEAREEALNRLRKIASLVPGVVYQYRLRPDGSSSFPFASEAIRELFRISPEDVREDAFSWFATFLHPDDYAGTIASILRSGQDLTHWDQEFRVQYADGTVRWMLGNAVPQREADGSTLWHGFITDITERKQSEEQLRIAAIAFELQEGIMITDANGVVLRVNQAYTEMSGYTAEECVGQTGHLLRSGRQNADFFDTMREAIQRTGGWQGEVWDVRKNGEEYPKWLTMTAVKDKNGVVTHYISAHFDISERKKAEEKINELAFYDQLTGLPNRTLLLNRLKQAMTTSARSGNYGALLFIDLDNFKTLNDTLGHDRGDQLLKQVAQRLTTCIRAGDTVARLGGDEFVVMLASLSMNARDAASQTEVVGEKILVVLNQTYQLNDIAYHSTPSIGATLFKGHQTEIDDLMKQTDLAMYKAKAAGRNALRFFDPDMEIDVLKRATLEKDLRVAIEERQFLLHYQAQMAGGQLTGAEVLVRWQHPQRGMVSPLEFIPLAEETGLILPLGLWVLETACTQLAVWAARPEMAHLTIAVNVSAHQFRQPDFVDKVLETLKNTRANPQRLKLELTESLLVSNVEEVIEKMFALKAKGVGFSLDDFGTGFSSLSYLKRLPLDQLKIDRSFVRDVLSDPNDASIARTIIALAQSLGLGVIAEGVETADQRDFLAGAGCHAYQGYFFSRPLPLEDFEEFAQPG